jgi:hypothetical protein
VSTADCALFYVARALISIDPAQHCRIQKATTNFQLRSPRVEADRVEMDALDARGELENTYARRVRRVRPEDELAIERLPPG